MSAEIIPFNKPENPLLRQLRDLSMLLRRLVYLWN